MNPLDALISVIIMQVATTLKGVTTALATQHWLKVTVSGKKCSHTFQEASYSRKVLETKVLAFLQVFTQLKISGQLDTPFLAGQARVLL